MTMLIIEPTSSPIAADDLQNTAVDVHPADPGNVLFGMRIFNHINVPH